MSLSLLAHRNFEVWVADVHNEAIPHGEVKVHGNTLFTSISLPKETDYSINWRSHPGTTHTVFCEIFVQGKKTRVATHFMDKDKPGTQSRSSLGRISPEVLGTQNNDWLQAPSPLKHAHVELRIRRARGTPIHQCLDDPGDPDNHIDEIDIDLIDDADEGKSPFVIFRLDFVPMPKQGTTAVAGPSAVPQKRKRLPSPPLSSARTAPGRRRQEPPNNPPPPRGPSPPPNGRANDGRNLLELLVNGLSQDCHPGTESTSTRLRQERRRKRSMPSLKPACKWEFQHVCS
ncbi:hypothetical protein DFH06DRAFT_7052 [Mycena polygramma]|nr:hypothetical protein DFH06DRAFT_7052 [Mycena polygramma]